MCNICIFKQSAFVMDICISGDAKCQLQKLGYGIPP